MKRIIMLLLALVMFSSFAIAETATASLQEIYAEAELLMVQGDYMSAAAKFEAMGAYSDASQMAMYCKAIGAAESMNLYDMSVEAFVQLGEFKDSQQMAKYYTARSYQFASDAFDVENDSDPNLDIARFGYNEAMAIYAELAFFKDSLTRVAACQEGIDAIDKELSERAAKWNEDTYQQAVTLENEGKYKEAIKAYKALNGYKDSKDRIIACENVIREEEYLVAIALENEGKYEEALKIYSALNGYKDSDLRATTCKEALVPFEDIGTMYNDRVLVVRNGKYGYLDIDGKQVIPCTYESGGAFICGLAPVSKNGKYGYIDRDGNEVIPLQYDEAYNFSADDGLAMVGMGGKYGFVELTGKVVVPLEYENVGSFSNGFAGVLKDGKWGVVDTAGKLVIDCIYQRYGGFDGKYFFVVQSHSWGTIDLEGNVVIPFEYDLLGKASEDLILAQKDLYYYGYINHANEVVIPFEYKFGSAFSDGIAVVQTDNGFAYIDSNGTILYEPSDYSSVSTFVDGMSRVYKNLKYGFVDMDWNPITDLEFDKAYNPNEGMAIVCKDNKWGFVSNDGNMLVPCEYDKVSYNEGWFVLLKNGKVKILSREEIQPGYKEKLEQQAKARAAILQEKQDEAENKKKILVEYTDKDTVKEVQAALNEAGYPCGTPDGAAGKKTIAALTDYQTAKGLTVTGTITHETLLDMGLAS